MDDFTSVGAIRVSEPAAACPGPELVVAAEQVVVGGETVRAADHSQVWPAPEEIPQTVVTQGEPGAAQPLRAGGGAAGGEAGGVEHRLQGGAQSLPVGGVLTPLHLLLLSPLSRENAGSQQQ